MCEDLIEMLFFKHSAHEMLQVNSFRLYKLICPEHFFYTCRKQM